MTLHPWALMSWSLACLVAAIAGASPTYRALVLVAAGIMVAAGHAESARPSWGLGKALLATGLGAVALNFLLSHTGTTVVVTLPGWVPLLGGPLTMESAAFGANTGLAIAAGILSVAPLSLQLGADELLDVLPRHLERTAGALATTLVLAPGLARSYQAIREAQVMRGWRPRGLRSWSEVVVPVALTAMEESIAMAEAMEARAFGSGPRTPSARRPWSPADMVTLGVALAVAAMFLGARALGLQEDWLTYPTLSVPPADPALLVGAVLLCLPGLLAWKRSPG